MDTHTHTITKKYITSNLIGKIERLLTKHQCIMYVLFILPNNDITKYVRDKRELTKLRCYQI